MAKYIVILGSLDTKGEEVDFLRRIIAVEGGLPFVIDTGVLNSPTTAADVTRNQVAEAADSSIPELIQANDKANALVAMAEGAGRILHELFQKGHLGGLISIGGSRGTALSTRVMQSIPVGIPKLMVSTMASGNTPFGPYTGTKDIMMMHSIADILGVNAILRPILTNAAAAVVAMSRVAAPVDRKDKRVLAASVLGTTTELVGRIKSIIEKNNYELIAFHAVGSGGRAMEEFIDSGLIEAVFDVTLCEMTAMVVDGAFGAGPNRLRAAGRKGIPQVLAPGGIDFIIEGSPEKLPAKYQERKIMIHTPTITLVRTTAEELTAVGRVVAERLAEGKGPAAVILPLQAFSAFSVRGQPLHDPVADQAFIEAFKSRVPPTIEVIELDTHINDPQVCDTATRWMLEKLG